MTALDATGPCAPWTPPASWTCDLTQAGMAVTGLALEMASEVLWNLSGQRFGLCEQTLRPCRASCFGNAWPFDNGWWEFGTYPRPVWFAGSWLNLTCGFCTDGCSCNVVETVRLPPPVAAVSSVVIDGVTLPPGSYRVDEWSLLRRIDGGSWPICNDLGKPAGAVGTWTVTFTYGEAVPKMGEAAVGQLAAELAKALVCDDSCKLPLNVQSISRQGVDITILDPNEVFANGRIGLYLPDLFLTMVDPTQQRPTAQVFDFDGESHTIVGT